MLKVTRTGSIKDVIAGARDVPARVLPYAAAAAITRSVKAGQKAVVAEMPRVFQSPTAYTLNSLYTVSASKDNLNGQIAVKTKAGNNAVPSENFLYPGVFGGVRRSKRFESSLSYAGVLSPGQWAITAKASELMDANGNIPGPKIVQLLSYFGGFQEQGYRANMKAKGKARLAKRGKTKSGLKTINGVEYFISQGPGERNGRRQHLAAGIYRRKGIHGSDIAPVVIFAKRTPQYRQRLDFAGIAGRTVQDTFPAEFRAAAAAILAKRR